MSDSLQPHGLYSPWNSPGQNTGAGGLSLLQGNLPNPGMEPRSPALQADSLPAEPPGKLLRFSNPTPGHTSTQNSNSKRHMHPTFTEALVTVTNTWKEPERTLTDRYRRYDTYMQWDITQP